MLCICLAIATASQTIPREQMMPSFLQSILFHVCCYTVNYMHCVLSMHMCLINHGSNCLIATIEKFSTMFKHSVISARDTEQIRTFFNLAQQRLNVA